MNLVAKTALLASFVLRPCHWDAQAAAWARLLPNDNPEEHAQLFAKMVTDGEAEAFEVAGPEGRIGVLVCHVDRSYPLPELAIHGAFSPETHRNLTAEFLPLIEAKTIELGCATVRFHTMRPGLVAKALGNGYQIREVILAKDVRHGS